MDSSLLLLLQPRKSQTNISHPILHCSYRTYPTTQTRLCSLPYLGASMGSKKCVWYREGKELHLWNLSSWKGRLVQRKGWVGWSWRTRSSRSHTKDNSLCVASRIIRRREGVKPMLVLYHTITRFFSFVMTSLNHYVFKGYSLCELIFVVLILPRSKYSCARWVSHHTTFEKTPLHGACM